MADIFNRIFMYENMIVSLMNSLKFVFLQGIINDSICLDIGLVPPGEKLSS